MTNKKLRMESSADKTAGEVLKFFGAMILLTGMKFSSRREVWSTTSDCESIPAMSFGQVMPLHRFETMLRCVRFSYQAEEHEDCSASEYRWQLCEGFIDAINAHREATVSPSELLCVDESISRWYGIGGSWISKGLPHYVAIVRKPESGCEIQDIADANGGFMLRLMLVKGADANSADHGHEEFNQGTNILLKLCAPWQNTWRTVCADSYFASVQAAKALYERGLHFIGVVKNATRMYPISYLANLPMPGHFAQKPSKHQWKAAEDHLIF